MCDSPFDKKKAAMNTKIVPLAIKDYIHRCYAESNSPLYYAFTQDMATTFRDKALFDNTIISII